MSTSKKVTKQSSVEYMISEETVNAQLNWGEKLSVMGTGDPSGISTAQIAKLTNVSAKNKRHIKAKIEEERIRVKNERRR